MSLCVLKKMDKDRLEEANEKFDKLKDKVKQKSPPSEKKETTGKSPQEAFRKNLGCGG